MATYKATRALMVAGQPVAEGDTFEADQEAVRTPLAKGWAVPATEAKPKAKRARRKT